jgi:hypothetical protein
LAEEVRIALLDFVVLLVSQEEMRFRQAGWYSLKQECYDRLKPEKGGSFPTESLLFFSVKNNSEKSCELN